MHSSACASKALRNQHCLGTVVAVVPGTLPEPCSEFRKDVVKIKTVLGVKLATEI